MLKVRICAVILTAVVVIHCGTVFAAGTPVDFSKITVNGVAIGNTPAQVAKSLGAPRRQVPLYLEYRNSTPLGRVTVELSKDKKLVNWVRNGSTLAVSGHKVLQAGDPASKIGKVFDNSIEHEVTTKLDSTDYVYKQSGTILVVVVKANKIAGFMFGSGWTKDQ